MYFRSSREFHHVHHDHLQVLLEDTIKEKALNFQNQLKVFPQVKKLLSGYFNKYDLSLQKMDEDYFKDEISQHILDLENNKRLHLVNRFNEIAWPEPLNKDESKRDK